jgi:hypothetical protein
MGRWFFFSWDGRRVPWAMLGSAQFTVSCCSDCTRALNSDSDDSRALVRAQFNCFVCALYRTYIKMVGLLVPLFSTFDRAISFSARMIEAKFSENYA